MTPELLFTIVGVSGAAIGSAVSWWTAQRTIDDREAEIRHLTAQLNRSQITAGSLSLKLTATRAALAEARKNDARDPKTGRFVKGGG